MTSESVTSTGMYLEEDKFHLEVNSHLLDELPEYQA
jgi:hypothetical protein